MTTLPRSAIAMVTLSTAWFVGLVAVAVHRHETVRSHRFDLGNMVQVVWSTAHGRPLEMTVGTGEQLSRLGIHVDPILALFAPLWWLAPSPLLLIVVQAAALAIGSLPVYWLARRHLASDAAAVLLGAAYLLYPSVVWNTLNDFHPVTLATPALLYAVWFLDTGRLRAFAVCAALVLATNELMGLTLAALGIWYALAHHRTRAGSVIAVTGLAWTALCLKVIVPAFRGGDSVFYDRFSTVGGSPAGIVRTVFTNPDVVLAELTTFEDVRYLLFLLLPFLGVFLASPLVLVALPQLAVNLLADFDSATLPQYQYVAAITPFLFGATVLGLRTVRPRLRAVAAGAIAAGCGLMLAIIPPRPGVDPFVFREHDGPRHLAAVEAALALVPADAAVSSTNRLGGQLSERRYVYSFPERNRAEYVVVDRRDPWLASAGEGDVPEVFERELGALRADRRFRLVFLRDGVGVWRRAR